MARSKINGNIGSVYLLKVREFRGAPWFPTLFILIGTFLMYGLKLLILGDRVDIFETDNNYLRWIEDVRDTPFALAAIPDVYLSSIQNIAAPEPVASFITYAFSFIFLNQSTTTYLHIYNLAFIAIYFFIISRCNVPVYVKLMLVTAISFGYYEFTTLHSTHRFKLALILLMVGLVLSKHRPFLSKNITALAYLTHFSLFAMIPLMFLIGRKVLKSVEPPSLQLIGVWAAAIYGSIAFALGSWQDLQQIAEVAVGNKLGHFGLSSSNLLDLIFISFFGYYVAIKLLPRFGVPQLISLAFIYLCSILVIFGTSRLLYTFYSIFLPVLIVAYGRESGVGKSVALFSIIPLVLYSFFKGMTLAPLPLYFDIL